MTTFRVMTYNVRYFGHSTRGIASTAFSLHRIASAIARLSPLPDLVCLQEVETTSLRSTWLHPRKHPAETQLERLLEALEVQLRVSQAGELYDGHYFPAHNYRITDQTSFYTTGLAILVRRPLRLTRHNADSPFDLTHRRGLPRAHATASSEKPWLKQTRICAHASFSNPAGESIDLFNTHLSLPSFAHAGFWRPGSDRMGHGPNQLEEARSLVEFVERERSSERFLITGDFNALPGSPVYEYLTGKNGWHDPLHVRLGNIDTLRRFPTAGFLHLRMHLDHMLSGPGIRWQDLDDTLPFGDPGSAFDGLSDHSPLIGRFTL
jgi:endonuclease/exonuclease/phosphatase family metal-dependent hydrolase